MASATLILNIILDGLTIGMIYILAAAGLSIVFGVMDVLNIAHGELFALGAYLAFAFYTAGFAWSWMFWVALIAVPLLVGALGMVIERFTIRPLYGRGHLDQALVTFGALLILYDARWLIWGRESQFVGAPPGLRGSISLVVTNYSAYNLFVIGFGAVLVAVTWAVLNYTNFGMIVRAGAQDREMVVNLGIDVNRYYTLLFGFGMALAGVGGVVLSVYQNVNLSMGHSVLIPAFVIVVIGGLGSFKGAVVGGIGVGILQSFMSVYSPFLSGVEIFLIMIAVLLVKPQGLFGNPHWEVPSGSASEFLSGLRGGVFDRSTRVKFGLVLVAVLAFLPLGAGSLYSGFYVTLMEDMLVWAILAVSLDIVMGYAGLISLGHAMFYGVGGYVAMLVFLHVTGSIFVALGLAILVCALIAVVVGYLSIQVKGPYFILITLGFAELFYNGITKFDALGGSNGLFGADPVLGIAGFVVPLKGYSVGIPPLTVEAGRIPYYLVLLSAVGAFLLARRIIHAPFGSVLKSIRESETRAQFVGYDVQRFKLQAFVISGAIGGLAGGLFAVIHGYAAPSLLHWLNSGELILMVVFGGMGTLYGSMIGAGVFVGLENRLADTFAAWRVVFGTVFIIFVIFVPQGLVSMPATVTSNWERLRNRLAGEPPVDDHRAETEPEVDD